MNLSLIVAFSENRVIGRDGDLPWRLSADLQRFKKLTMGHHIIMGRKTYESINRLLPGRTTVVITRNPAFKLPGAIIANSLTAALAAVADDPEPFVIGGAEIFEQALPLARKLYLTRVLAEIEGDCFFPEINWREWRNLTKETVASSANNQFPHSFEIYERVNS